MKLHAIVINTPKPSLNNEKILFVFHAGLITKFLQQ